VVGFGLISSAAAFIVLIWAGTFLPGLAGEVFSRLAGIMWTPVLLDLTLFGFGLALVFLVNAWMRRREGDELVFLEQVDDRESPSGMPAAARSAVFPYRPETRDPGPALAAIEGALEIPDLQEAANLLYQLPPESLDTPEVLELRLRLARAQDRPAQVRELEARLAKQRP